MQPNADRNMPTTTTSLLYRHTISFIFLPGLTRQNQNTTPFSSTHFQPICCCKSAYTEVNFKLGGEKVKKWEVFVFDEQQQQSQEKTFLRRCSHESKGFGQAPINWALLQFNWELFHPWASAGLSQSCHMPSHQLSALSEWVRAPL